MMKIEDIPNNTSEEKRRTKTVRHKNEQNDLGVNLKQNTPRGHPIIILVIQTQTVIVGK